MPTIDAVLKTALQKITPSEQEAKQLNAVVEKVKETTNNIIKPLGYEFVLAGSFSRNTWLSHKKEFDIFILFPESHSREDLEKDGLEIGKKIVSKLKGKYEIAYAEHPYTRAKIEGFDVDLVPAYKVESAEKIKSAVDRTPFHNKYLDIHLGNLAPEVRLLKKFCKSIGVYGSDLKTQGFSGYLCELLVINYKSFQNLAKRAPQWWVPGKTFIDLENIYKGNRKEFEHQPLVVIDPVDPKRNVAASVSPSNFIKLLKACQQFVASPSEKMFFSEDPKPNKANLLKQIKLRGTKLILLEFSRPKVVDDIIYSQLRKAAKRLAGILKEQEFVSIGQDAFAGEKKCYILLELEVWKLPNIRKVTGPPIFVPTHSEEFIKKYKPLGRILIEEDKWVAEVDRKFLTAYEKLADSLTDKEEELKAKGIPSYVAEEIPKGYKLFEAEKTLRPGLEEFVFKYLNDRISV